MKTYKARWECICGEPDVVSADTDLFGRTSARKNAILDGDEHRLKKGCGPRGVFITDVEEKE